MERTRRTARGRSEDHFEAPDTLEGCHSGDQAGSYAWPGGGDGVTSRLTAAACAASNKSEQGPRAVGDERMCAAVGCGLLLGMT